MTVTSSPPTDAASKLPGPQTTNPHHPAGRWGFYFGMTNRGKVLILRTGSPHLMPSAVLVHGCSQPGPLDSVAFGAVGGNGFVTIATASLGSDSTPATTAVNR